MKQDIGFLDKSTRKPTWNCSETMGIKKILLTSLFIYFIAAAPFSIAQSDNQSVFTVVLDAGHGGKDPGSVGKNTYEKNLALSIVKKIGYYIESLIPDARVIYTRKTDVFVDLDVRADIANRNNADLFISVHVNSIPRGKAVGTETWVMGIAKNPGNLELVKKENEVIMLEDDYSSKYEGYDPENPGSLIGFSVMQNIYQSQSLNMASYVQDQFRTRAKRKDRGVKAGQLLVLWKTTMPSVLVETGFLSDSNEEAFLMTDYGQDLSASAVYRAFRKYKEEIDERTTRELQVNAEEEQRTQQRINRITEPETKTNRETEVLNDAAVKEVKIQTDPVKQTQTSQTSLQFRVQILAAENRVPKDARDFRGYTDFEELKIDGYYKYMSAPVNNYAQALNVRKQLLDKFPGAFIVGFKNGKKIPLMQAIEEDKKIH